MNSRAHAQTQEELPPEHDVHAVPVENLAPFPAHRVGYVMEHDNLKFQQKIENPSFHNFQSFSSDFDVDVIGGDASYLDNLTGTRQLEHPGVHLHAPNHKDTNRIYAESKININITSIQFDSAIVNRVIDIAAVGGFVLTDWKEDLKEITSVYELISYLNS